MFCFAFYVKPTNETINYDYDMNYYVNVSHILSADMVWFYWWVSFDWQVWSTPESDPQRFDGSPCPAAEAVLLLSTTTAKTNGSFHRYSIHVHLQISCHPSP